jgi:dTDP-4-dehydrorhamnose 3,5-epimerase-like enzyme
MRLPQFGTDPTDYLSKPINTRKTKLSRIFEIPVRKNTEKSGRKLTVVWDERNPLTKGFKNRYCYLVSFDKKNNIAGNHYHKYKTELFTPTIGSVTVLLEDTKTKIQESIILKINQILYIPPKIAHTVISNSTKTVLLITANYPNNKEDEFPYKILKR